MPTVWYNGSATYLSAVSRGWRKNCPEGCKYLILSWLPRWSETVLSVPTVAPILGANFDVIPVYTMRVVYRYASIDCAASARHWFETMYRLQNNSRVWLHKTSIKVPLSLHDFYLVVSRTTKDRVGDSRSSSGSSGDIYQQTALRSSTFGFFNSVRVLVSFV